MEAEPAPVAVVTENSGQIIQVSDLRKKKKYSVNRMRQFKPVLDRSRGSRKGSKITRARVHDIILAGVGKNITRVSVDSVCMVRGLVDLVIQSVVEEALMHRGEEMYITVSAVEKALEALKRRDFFARVVEDLEHTEKINGDMKSVITGHYGTVPTIEDIRQYLGKD